MSSYPFLKYCNKNRWDTYYKQLELAYMTGSKSFLIIGPGDHIVPVVLRRIIPDAIVDTFDIREGSTYQGDLCNISDIVTKHYDCILCCEVLEHIEFEYFEIILNQLKSICKKIIISIPKYTGKICKYHKWEVGYNTQTNINSIKLCIDKVFESNRFDFELNKIIFIKINCNE